VYRGQIRVTGSAGTHFGTPTAVVPVLHQTVYIAVTAFVINLVVSVVLTLVLRALRAPAGTDETQSADYLADQAPAPVPVPVKTAP
jgi:SSS family solute:Na+ symporter